MPSRATSVANRAAAKKKDRKYSDVLLKQVAELRAKHPGMIAFVRIGESFDVIGEDADVVASVLGLKAWPDGDTKYVTFPADELEARLAVMLRAGKRCAVCEPNGASVSYGEPKPEPKPEPEPVASPATVSPPEVRVIALADITADADLNPRHELNADAIEEYSGIYKVDPKRLPRPIVFLDDQDQFWLASGFHRTSGASDAGLTEIECEVRRGSRLDALVFAAGENKGNGVRRTAEDKRKAVANLLRACPDWSNRRIGEYVEVSHHTVAEVKKDIFPNATAGKVIGKDGKAQAAKKKPAPVGEPSRPAAEPSWRALPVAEVFDPDASGPAFMATIAKFAERGATTCGALADQILAGATFGLPLVELFQICESLEFMSSDDERPVRFPLTRPSEDEDEDEDKSPVIVSAAEKPGTSSSATPATPPPEQPREAAPQSSDSKSYANPAGHWKWLDADVSKNEIDAEIVLVGGIVTGTVGSGTIDKGPHFREGTYSAGVLDFDVTAEDKATGEYVTSRYTGHVHADHITGTIVRGGNKTRWEARRIADRVARDMLGRELPTYLKPIFAKEARGKLIEAARLIANGAQAIRFIDADPLIGGFLKTRPHLAQEPKVLAAYIRRDLVPYCVCPICDGDGDSQQCPTCGGKGWLSRRTFDEASGPARERAKSFKPGKDWEDADSRDANEDAPEINPTRFIPAGPGLDPTGHEIPPALRDLFAADWLQDEVRRLDRLAQMLRGSTAWLAWLKPEAHAAVDQAARLIRDAIPFAVCRECGGKATGCGACKLSGYIPKYEHENIQAQARQQRSETRTDTKKNRGK